VTVRQEGGGAARLRSRPLLEEQELAPRVIDPGFVQVDDDLQREDEVTVEVAVQRVPVSLAVAQQDGR
jgi:MOSC domain-containing protein YiiM